MSVTSLLACPFCAEALSKREMLGFTISIFLLLGLLYGLASLVVRAMIREEKKRAAREDAAKKSREEAAAAARDGKKAVPAEKEEEKDLISKR